jgi:transposase
MSATQTITHDGAATLDTIGRRSSPKLTAHAAAAAARTRVARESRTSPAPVSRRRAASGCDDGSQRNDRDGRDERDGLFALSPAHCERLTRWTRAATSPRRVVTRSLVVLLAASGASNVAIAARLGVTRATVALWKTRFLDGGPDALLTDAPGRGRKPGRDPHLVARILHASTQRPPHGDRWTLRHIAARVGASHATVQRVLREHGAAAMARPAHAIAVESVHGSHASIRPSCSAHPVIVAEPVHAAQASRIGSSRGARAVGIASAQAAQTSGISSSRAVHAVSGAGASVRAAQAISETPRAAMARGGMAAALPLFDASSRVITTRHRRDDVRSRRSIFRKVTA